MDRELSQEEQFKMINQCMHQMIGNQIKMFKKLF